ncbi:MAG TPA: ATP-binding protein, partial [Kineobactrum sp.]
IDIIDQGTGVPLKDRSKLFEPFYTTVSEGSGMGLFLCKELCEINNAGIHYRTTNNGESCFRLSLNQRVF